MKKHAAGQLLHMSLESENSSLLSIFSIDTRVLVVSDIEDLIVMLIKQEAICTDQCLFGASQWKIGGNCFRLINSNISGSVIVYLETQEMYNFN